MNEESQVPCSFIIRKFRVILLKQDTILSWELMTAVVAVKIDKRMVKGVANAVARISALDGQYHSIEVH